MNQAPKHTGNWMQPLHLMPVSMQAAAFCPADVFKRPSRPPPAVHYSNPIVRWLKQGLQQPGPLETNGHVLFLLSYSSRRLLWQGKLSLAQMALAFCEQQLPGVVVASCPHAECQVHSLLGQQTSKQLAAMTLGSCSWDHPHWNAKCCLHWRQIREGLDLACKLTLGTPVLQDCYKVYPLLQL